MSTTNGLARVSIAFSKPKNAPTKHAVYRSTLHESDDEDATHAPVQPVSHFDQSVGGAIDARAPKQENAPLVIRKQANRNWREESQRKRQHSRLPTKAGADAGTTNGHDGRRHTAHTAPISYGLTVVHKPQQGEVGTDRADSTLRTSPAPRVLPKSKTDDELALEALLGDKPKSSLVLPTVDNEDDAFQRDYKQAPDMATLEAYKAVPVEEFGAALLRGMGWKDGEAIGRQRGQQVKPRTLERRPALLGLGAKEDAAVGESGRGSKATNGRRKVDEAYNPVVLRDHSRRRSRSPDRTPNVDDDRPSKRRRYPEEASGGRKTDHRRRDSRHSTRQRSHYRGEER